MTFGRHGCRVLGLLSILVASGCGKAVREGTGPPSRPLVSSSVAKGTALVLAPIPGPPAAVSEIVWGGTIATGRVGVRWADGRFAVFDVDHPASIRGMGTGPNTNPIRALALTGPDRAVTADASGLVLWDTSQPLARTLDRVDCGPISALIVDRESALIAGSRDGGLLRFEFHGDDRLGRASARMRAGSPSPVARLVVPPGRREILAIHDDGTAWNCRIDLIGSPTPFGTARSIACSLDGRTMARLEDGPRIVVVPAGEKGAIRHFSPPLASATVTFADQDRMLVVSAERSLLILPLPALGPMRPTEFRQETTRSGTPIVAVAPEGIRLAVGDGSGRVEILDGPTLADRAGPMSLDDVPELAFEPARRFDRPRPVAESSGPDPGIARAIEELRSGIDRGETVGVAASLQSMAADPRATRADKAELLAMEAALDQRGGASSAGVSRQVLAARESFARNGQADRDADMAFWLGLLSARPFDTDAGPHEAMVADEAVASLRDAARLYRAGPRPLERQALLCDATRAWVLLDRGDLHAALRAFTPVVEARQIDPVLGQVVELNRIAAALASARGDWARAASSDARVIGSLSPTQRPGLRREAVLSRVAALAALDLWKEAAESLGGESPDDPVWTIRRASCRLHAGLPVAAPGSTGDDPTAAHVRALIALRGGVAPTDRVVADLELAAEGHRRGGLDDLAIEADLARAEVLERLGRWPEAAAGHAAVARELFGPGRERPRRPSRPVGYALTRAARGLARAEMAVRRPGHALAALTAAESTHEVASLADSPTIGPALGLAAAEFPLAEALRDARARLDRSGGLGAGPEATSAAIEVRRLETALSGHARGLIRPDPTSRLDPATLGLSATEAVLVFAAVGPDSVAGVLVRGVDEPEVVLLSIGRSRLDRDVRAWRASLGDGARPIGAPSGGSPIAILALGPEPDPPGAISKHERAGSVEARLHDALIGPFESRLSGVTRLVLIPGAVLASMPLDVLGRESRLIERFSVRYLPSLSFLAALRDDRRPERASGRKLLLIAPEGGRSWNDFSASCRASGWTVDSWLGPEARPDRILEGRLSDYEAVHLNSAAIWFPSRSVGGETELLLSSGGDSSRSDGRLAAHELASVPMKARVLVLSVADRAGSSAEGLRDLARAGLLTGARHVLLPLWPPPAESSRKFFADFYRALGSGETTESAFTLAKSATASDPRFRDPVHWAGYVLSGP